MIVIVSLLSLVIFFSPYLSGVPDEAFYSSIFCLLAFLALISGLWISHKKGVPEAGSEKSGGRAAESALALLFGIALLSLLVRLMEDRTIAYLGPMLRGWMILGAEIGLFMLARRAARASRAAAFVLLLAAILASALVSEIGVNEYLMHRSAGQPDWRIFATSTPDFLAGYLVMLLPPTFALFLGVPWQRQKQPLIGIMLTFLLLIILALQTVVLLRTQSRFALISLSAGLAVFLLAVWQAKRAGFPLELSSKWRLAVMALFLLFFGVHFARPVLARVQNTHITDNSTAFRLYTWRGAYRMALHNPVIGTGIGTWVDLYPRYAITGFTRLAHDSYLQMADECGLPSLLVLLIALGASGGAIWQGLRHHPKTVPARDSSYLSYLASRDDRLLLAGLLGGLVAGTVQNIIDSDWYVFFLGVTFWALAGLAVGIGESQTPAPAPSEKKSRAFRYAIGTLAALFALDMGMQALGAYDAQQATSELGSSSPNATSLAEQDFGNAIQWDPLKGEYLANLGYGVFYEREGRLPDAISTLRAAVHLSPTSLNYSFLAAALNAAHDFPAALRALQEGIVCDPNSIDLRMTLAEMLPPPQSLEYYRQIAAIEETPVGQVRALGNVVEYQFAIADSNVADAEAANQQAASALQYDQRADRLLEQYANDGGTNNPQQQALMGDHPDPALDAQMGNLYHHVILQMIALSPPNLRPVLQEQETVYTEKFAQVFAHSSQPGTT